MISQDGGSNRWREGAHMKEGLIREGGRIVDRESKRGGVIELCCMEIEC